MMISTMGRYALRIMLDLAERNTGEYIPLMEIAKRQEISEKYLESIVSILSKNGFVTALRGKGGGYRLARNPDTYTVGSILKLTEGSLAPVSCMDGDINLCERAGECRTLPMWSKLDKLIDDFVEGITLEDLLRGDEGGDNYVI